MCSLVEQCGSWRGTGAQRPRRNSRAFGCWVRDPLKGWNESGDVWPPFFLTDKSTFKYQNHTLLRFYGCTNSKIPERGGMCRIQRYNRKCCCTQWPAVQHLVLHVLLLYTCVVITYLHSPFPFKVASHLPPFKHDSVGREHFRPVGQKEHLNTRLNQQALM